MGTQSFTRTQAVSPASPFHQVKLQIKTLIGYPPILAGILIYIIWVMVDIWLNWPIANDVTMDVDAVLGFRHGCTETRENNNSDG
jgi:hypothetical protein